MHDHGGGFTQRPQPFEVADLLQPVLDVAREGGSGVLRRGCLEETLHVCHNKPLSEGEDIGVHHLPPSARRTYLRRRIPSRDPPIPGRADGRFPTSTSAVPCAPPVR